MFLNTLVPPEGSNKGSKRVGRGVASGHGKTSGRGEKGAGARKSPQKGKTFLEGGNYPLWRSIPKRGFNSTRVRDTQIVNLGDIAALGLTEVTPLELAKVGLIKKADKPVKILATGELTAAVNMKVHAISQTALEAVEKAGGKVEII